MNKILVLTDFSASAKNAANIACELAILNQHPIELFSAYLWAYVESGVFIDFDTSLKKSVLKQLKKEEERLLKKFPKLAEKGIFTETATGDLDLLVREREKVGDIELIVMGAKGKSAWEEVLLGSETARIIENSKTPVLAVPISCKTWKNNRVLFSCELNEKLQKQELTLLKKWIPEKAELHLFHNYESFTEIDIPSEEQLYLDYKSSFAKNLLFLNIDYDKKTVHSIEKYTKVVKPDFLITRKKHQGFLKKLFGGSVTKSLSFHTKIPLLVFK